MDSIQQREMALEEVRELQDRPELDPVEQMKLDRLIREINEFNEKLSNFE